MTGNLFRLASRVFNKPLLATEDLAHSVSTYLSNRLYNFDNLNTEQLAVNLNKVKGEAADYVKVTADGVAIIPIMGALAHRMSGIDAICTGGLNSYEGIRRAFDEAMADDSVKSILLNVDSGGGEASGCFELARHIASKRGDKRIVAFVDESACSAAYALACAADEIVATPESMTGSIGVVMVHQEVSKAMEKAGVTATVFRAGANKALGTPYEALNDEAKQKFEKRLAELHDGFVNHVAKMRGISPDTVRATEAGVFNAQEALDLGLIDKVMSTDELERYVGNSLESSSVSSELTVTPTNTGTEMSEQELKELQELREQVAQFKAQEEQKHVASLAETLADSAVTFGFDANAIAGAMLAHGKEAPLSVAFMNLLTSANEKLAEMSEKHQAELAEQTRAIEAAREAVITSEAMKELGAEGEAAAEEPNTDLSPKAQVNNNELLLAELKKLALQNA